jgi:hypothetical protein
MNRLGYCDLVKPAPMLGTLFSTQAFQRGVRMGALPSLPSSGRACRFPGWSTKASVWFPFITASL